MTIRLSVEPPNMRALRRQFDELSDKAILGAAVKALNTVTRQARKAALEELANRKGIPVRALSRRAKRGTARTRKPRTWVAAFVARFPFDRMGKGRATKGGRIVRNRFVPDSWWWAKKQIILARTTATRYPTERAAMDLLPDAREIFDRIVERAVAKDYPELTRLEASKRALAVASKYKPLL